MKDTEPDLYDERHEPTARTISHDDASRWSVDRRTVLRASGLVGVSALAGCSSSKSGDGGAVPDPISLGGSKRCDVCGMVISEHSGPTGQIFYQEHTPDGHDNPAMFDSIRSCLLPYYFDHQRSDWSPEAIYVTDYSVVDYEISSVKDKPYIEKATAPETFSEATDVVFVVESEVHGAMGPDFVPFSKSADADTFVDEYGGRTLSWEEMEPVLLGG